MINFIVNTHSGKGLGEKNLNRIIKYCYKKGIAYTVHITNAPWHASTLAAELSERDPQSAIVAVGGDGTFHEVLNGIKDPSQTPVGFVPSGRGNDFARGVGIPMNVEKALDAIVGGKTAYYDYIQIGDKRCLNVSGTGLDIDVLQRVAGRNGKITYLKSLIYCLRHFEPYHVEVTNEDGTENSYDVIMIGVGNGSRFGGGIKICPNAKVNDGLLDITIITMPEDGRVFPVLPAFVKGKHDKIKVISSYRCKSIKIKTEKPVQLDGEIYNGLDMDCKIVAGGLKSFVY